LLIASAGFAQTAPYQLGTPQLRKGVDAWPLILNPSNPAQQRVNATLTEMNQRMAQSMRDCDKRFLQSLKQLGVHASGRDLKSGSWSRKVQVTMFTPRFLSMVATDDYIFCGGAHPASDTIAMVFDMSTGATVDWTALIAPSAQPSTYSDKVSDGSTVTALVLPALKKMSLAATDAGCKNIYWSRPPAFVIWPDAYRGTLVAKPFGLPHAAAACAAEINLSVEQARAMGFSDVLLTDIEQVHGLLYPVH
jgi:hypothetical protein